MAESKCGLTRRQFLAASAAGVVACAVMPPLSDKGEAAAVTLPEPTVRARHFEKLPNNVVRCKLEPRQCELVDGERGFCGVRENRGGVYYSVVYGLPCSVHAEPIEENFLHALPGSKSLDVGTAGCNLQCTFCNTAHISQTRPEDTPFERVSPERLVDRAIQEGCRSICFTDNDPVVCFEYVMDASALAQKRGLKTFCHTAGVIHDEPLDELISVMNGIAVDLKGATEGFYKELCGVSAQRVYATAYRIRKKGIHLEVATPLVPGYNDSKAFVSTMAQWIIKNLGPETPWQLLRFFPAYRLTNLEANSMFTLRELREVALAAGLNHVYLGGLARPGDTSVLCPKCRKPAIVRDSDGCDTKGLQNGKCCNCGQTIQGVWD